MGEVIMVAQLKVLIQTCYQFKLSYARLEVQSRLAKS